MAVSAGVGFGGWTALDGEVAVGRGDVGAGAWAFCTTVACFEAVALFALELFALDDELVLVVRAIHITPI